MVFYRKYRPQKISELDSEHLRERLYSIFSKGFDAPHALLFSGPKGLGKTSAARIVAKVLNCEKHSKLKRTKLTEAEIEPDNKCWQCTSITNGTNFDVLEIDGASNRGIDEIRDLREKINLLPTKSAKKVYIIDEVHMLTTEAFNALLKTLEEPPAHAIFILCTTELHKVPQTIVSRCFKVEFQKATDEEIARSLSRIIKNEDIRADKEVVLEIAKMSEGSFRDAAKILEDLAFSAGRKALTRQLLEQKFNTLGVESSLNEFSNALQKKDSRLGFEIIQKLAAQGVDFKFFIEGLLSRFHMILLSKIGAGNGQTDDKFEVFEIKTILELLSRAHSETKYAVLPQLPLELVLVEWCEDSKAIGSQSDVVDDARQTDSKAQREARSLSEGLSKRSSASRLTSNGKINDFSVNFINEVKGQNHLIAGVLRSCEIENGKKGLQIVAISKFHKEKLEEEKSLEILQRVAENLIGGKIKIEISLRG